MATVTAPFTDFPSGQVRWPTLTRKPWKGRTVCQFRSRNTTPPTAAQLAIQNMVGAWFGLWWTLTTDQRRTWTIGDPHSGSKINQTALYLEVNMVRYSLALPWTATFPAFPWN
jgi:hypothetical protein